ncbi:MAG: sigma-70 family RNA polymerase sigma factor [Acidobacteriota bacterium]
MSGTHETLAKNDLIARVLCDKRADFEAFVRARVRSEEANDVLQMAALRAIERADSLDDPDRVVAWLYRLHRNLIVDVIRKRSSDHRVIDPAAEVPDQAPPLPSDLCACSVTQANHIRSAYSSILTLVDIGGMGLNEAARTLGITVNNATVRLHRARRALREKMLEHCGVSNFQDCATCRCVHDGCC